MSAVSATRARYSPQVKAIVWAAYAESLEQHDGLTISLSDADGRDLRAHFYTSQEIVLLLPRDGQQPYGLHLDELAAGNYRRGDGFAHCRRSSSGEDYSLRLADDAVSFILSTAQLIRDGLPEVAALYPPSRLSSLAEDSDA